MKAALDECLLNEEDTALDPGEWLRMFDDPFPSWVSGVVEESESAAPKR